MDALKKNLALFPQLENSFLFFMAALITGGFGDRLMPAPVLDLLEGDRVGHLICGFLVIIFTIEIFNDKIKSIFQPLMYSAVIFVLYIIISKQSPKFFLGSIVLLLINFLIYKQYEILRDNVSDKEDPNRKSKMKKLLNIYNLITTLIIGVVICGFSMYFSKQYTSHAHKSKSFLEFLAKFLLEGSSKIYKGTAKVFDE